MARVFTNSFPAMELIVSFLSTLSLLGTLLSMGYVEGRFTLEQQRSVDDFVTGVLKCRQIPAMTIAVVRGGDTLMTRAYGRADIEHRVNADAETLFCIGSLSKAFTSTLLAGLLAENSERFSWDTPVASIVGSDFKFFDDIRTQHVNIRDLLAHKTGIPMYFQALLTGFPKSLTLKDLVERIQFLKPTKMMRSTFMYNNYMYGLAGYIASKMANGVSWETLVRERIFKPLNMTSSGFIDETPTPPKFAYPYVTVNGTFVRIDPQIATGVYPSGPAGSIISNAIDMAKWLKFQLRVGIDANGKRLVSKKHMEDTHAGEMPQPFKDNDLHRPKYPVEDVRLSYSMGWVNSVYRGYKRRFHTGGISTYSSQLWLFPDLDIGVYVNINGPLHRNRSLGMRAVQWYLADLLLGETPWLDLNTACSFPEPWVSVPKQTLENVTSDYYVMALNHTAYAGTYSHQAFGNITVYLNKTSHLLNMKQGRFGHAVLKPKSKEEFIGKWIGPLWFLSDSDEMNMRVKVIFNIFDHKSGMADELRINIDQSILTSFKRSYVKNDHSPGFQPHCNVNILLAIVVICLLSIPI